jgi:hypothetical protein
MPDRRAGQCLAEPVIRLRHRTARADKPERHAAAAVTNRCLSTGRNHNLSLFRSAPHAKRTVALNNHDGPMASETIKLASDDEANLILEVAKDVAARLGWAPPAMGFSTNPLKSIRSLALRQNMNHGAGASIGMLINYFNPGTISRDDLTVLAPYIDDWLNGNPPAFDLPAEYDRRIEFLNGFKERMVASGVWPAANGVQLKPRPAT